MVTLLRLVKWMVIGPGIYFGVRHSAILTNDYCHRPIRAPTAMHPKTSSP